MISPGRSSVTLNDIRSITTDAEIVYHYLGVSRIPCVINSPLRQDNHPSFALYSPDGNNINYIDFSTNERGSLYTLLKNIWNTSYIGVYKTIYDDFYRHHGNKAIIDKSKSTCIIKRSNKYSVEIKCKTREWRNYDLKFWESYGVSKEWLEFADIYPISHKIICKDGKEYVFNADKYSYAFIEYKEGKTSMKIYSPYNDKGFKWSTSTDKSVWSLWTKIPKKGKNLFITSSLKDCLNLWSNLGIPAICLQGEGYIPKPHVMEELKSRYDNIIVFYDNDYAKPNNPGRRDSIALANEYNLKRVEIPEKYEAKDPSDLYKKYGKDKYIEIMKDLLSGII